MDMRTILAVAIPVVYAVKRVWQKIKDGKNVKPWYKETENWGLILTELGILFGDAAKELVGGS